MKNSFDEADELDGFEDLNDDDQEKIRKAWGEGKVADEDIPDTARKADGEDDEEEEEEKPKAKKGGKKKADAEKDGDGGKGVFKLEYASSARAKCKSACPYCSHYISNANWASYYSLWRYDRYELAVGSTLTGICIFRGRWEGLLPSWPRSRLPRPQGYVRPPSLLLRSPSNELPPFIGTGITSGVLPPNR